MKIPKNIRPLLGSVIAAIVLWLIVATEKQYLYQIEVPINLVRIAEGKILSDKIPDKAEIEFKGRGRSLIAMLFYNVAFNIELPELKESKTIELKDLMTFLDLPSTFGVEAGDIIEPHAIDFQIDDLVVMQKPVTIAGDLSMEDGYVLMQRTLEPDTAVITGPRQKIEKIQSILTEPVSQSGIRLSFKERVGLQNPLPGITTIEPAMTEASFDVQRLIERVVYDIPIRVVNTPSHLQVEAVPNRLSLKISGGETLVAGITSADIIAEIDFVKHYRVNVEYYAASIVTPPDIRWIESIPKSFKLKVRRRSR